MGRPNGFSFETRRSGDVIIWHNGRHATTLRGRMADGFLAALDAVDDAQDLMARLTGNYRRGNERDAAKRRRRGH